MTRGAFISYSSADRDFVRRLAEDLRRHDIPVWFDEDVLAPGDSIIGAIEAGIDRTAFLIVVLSPDAVASGWVAEELRMALHKGISGQKVAVIPVLREDCEIPGFLRDRKYVDMRPGADYAAGLEKLVRRLRRDLELAAALPGFIDDLEAPADETAEPDGAAAERRRDMERIRALTEKALGRELDLEQWQAAVAPLLQAAGKARTVFDQREQRVNVQFNVGNITIRQPVAAEAPPADLEVHAEALRRRIREGFCGDAPYYVPLAGETTERADGDAACAPDRSARRRRMRPEYRAWIGEGREIRRVKLATLREGVDRYPCIILLGEPGCGKTTALRHLAYQLAGGPGRLPLPLALSGFARHMALEDFILQGLSDSPDPGRWRWGVPQLAAHLDSLLKAGRLFLLLDALNEMPHRGYRRRVEELRRFIDRWTPAGNRFLVTCRVLDYGEELSGLQRIEIQPLSGDRIRDFLRRELGDGWEDLWRELARDPDRRRSLLGLARNPYMLTVMIDVFKEDGRLGDSRSRLMERFTRILMGWARRKCPAEKWLDPGLQRASLSVLAYEIQEREGSGTRVERALAEAVMPGEVKLRDNWTAVPAPPGRVLDLAASAHIIEMSADRRSLRFYHQLLQEYFAARRMLRRDTSLLEDKWRWPWREEEMPPWTRPDDNYDPLPPPPPTGWEETTVLAAGLAPENDDRLVRALVRVNPVLAGRCLHEGRAAVRPATRRAVVDALLAAVSDPDVALRVRIAAGEVLGFLGDPRIGETVLVPAGEFVMGDDEDEGASPEHRLFLPDYRIGRYPVTNAEFAAFVDAGGYREARWWTPEGWEWTKRENWQEPDYWQDAALNTPNRPVVGVTWYECAAFCRWLAAETGRPCRLPTEAQWEKAARGTDGRAYPWEGDFDPRHLNSWEGEQAVSATTPVGIYPTGASPFGCLDMAGNVWEWTVSLWGEDWGKPDFRYPYRPDDGREDLETSNEILRVLRGGSWHDHRGDARCAFRRGLNPDYRLDDGGFRVVFSPSLPSDSLRSDALERGGKR